MIEMQSWTHYNLGLASSDVGTRIRASVTEYVFNSKCWNFDFQLPLFAFLFSDVECKSKQYNFMSCKTS